ncbi:unnamed protein product [Rhizophagus irregularis]|nr:unnamed protein product [Rhizophagus irregularis]
MKEIVRELKIQREVDFHDNIIHCYGITKLETENYNNYRLVMEYADGGTLRSYLKENTDKLTWNDKYNMAYQLSCAVSCLHNERIVHRDLHSSVEISQGLRETVVPDTPEEYVKIYTKCWDGEPDNRPTIYQVVDWLNTLQYMNLDFVIKMERELKRLCNGVGTKIDKQKAFELYQDAANLGHDIAQNNLAVLYEKEMELQKDIDKAIYCIKL